MNEQSSGTGPGGSALAAFSDALADAVAQAAHPEKLDRSLAA